VEDQRYCLSTSSSTALWTTTISALVSSSHSFTTVPVAGGIVAGVLLVLVFVGLLMLHRRRRNRGVPATATKLDNDTGGSHYASTNELPPEISDYKEVAGYGELDELNREAARDHHYAVVNDLPSTTFDYEDVVGQEGLDALNLESDANRHYAPVSDIPNEPPNTNYIEVVSNKNLEATDRGFIAAAAHDENGDVSVLPNGTTYP
jgi:hypothetical protein